MLLIEHKSRGKDLDRAHSQARDYFSGLTEAELPRYLLVSDFARFRLCDLESDEPPVEFAIAELHKHVRRFGFTAGYQARSYQETYRKFKRPFRAGCRVGVGPTRARLRAAWAQIRTSARRFRLCGGALRGSAWPFLTDSRGRAERSAADRGRIVSSSRFRPRPFDCAQERL